MREVSLWAIRVRCFCRVTFYFMSLREHVCKTFCFMKLNFQKLCCVFWIQMYARNARLKCERTRNVIDYICKVRGFRPDYAEPYEAKSLSQCMCLEQRTV